MTEPDSAAPVPRPLATSSWRGAGLPIPVVVAAVLTGLAFLSVLAIHETARWVGLGWMAFGLLFYVVYRKLVEETSLTRRVSVTERALTKQVREISYRNILVPVFGTELDDDIVSTAGRLAAATAEESDGAGDGDPRLDLVYVIEVPLTRPLDADLPAEREEQARRALERAREVGEEYENFKVVTELLRARDSARASSKRRSAATPRRSSSAASRRQRSAEARPGRDRGGEAGRDRLGDRSTC